MFPLCRHLAFSLEPTVDSGHSPCSCFLSSAHTVELFLQLGFSKRLSSVSPEGGLSSAPQPLSPSLSLLPSLSLSFLPVFLLSELSSSCFLPCHMPGQGAQGKCSSSCLSESSHPGRDSAAFFPSAFRQVSTSCGG